MFWHLIATFIAGLGAAGIALLLRKLSGNRLPRGITPTLAGLAMLAFQLVSEYQWFSHQQQRLPANLQVVMTVAESTPWRPWSYLWPQVTRFMAADRASISRNQLDTDVLLVDLYLFAPFSPTVPVKQLLNCRTGLTADFDPQHSAIPAADQWYALPTNNQLRNLCQSSPDTTTPTQ